MKVVIFISLLVALQTSIFIHIFCFIGYISTKKSFYFNYFVVTALSNISTSIALAIMVALDQSLVKGLKMDLVLLLESGLLFVYMVTIKVRLTAIIIRRMHNPNNFHLSHFGKKIYDTTVIDFKELMTYIVTVPFTLMAGAYFLVKIMHF